MANKNIIKDLMNEKTIEQIAEKTQGFLCACHGGRFNASGVNQPGTPPPRPMEIPPFKIDGMKMVLGEEGAEYQALKKA